ncbi:lectin-like protein [Roseibium sp. HPY-6]|uniref:lectin-like protein n=1 Tax=Roseibium sp. HPY-6 TaxID=3229852 RepID=UPI00338E3464
MKRILATAVVSLALISSAAAAPFQWTAVSGGNDHWYEFVVLGVGDPSLSATQAEALAESSSFMGLGGYLATITSAAEQSFLNMNWTGAGSVTGQFLDYSYFLIGATDRDTEGSFEWLGGPDDGNPLGHTNWKLGEPNNAGGEDYVVAWWEDSATGAWNDVPGNSGVRAYLVEYSGAPVPVPLPAALPLLVGGLGLLGFAAHRRRRTSEV